MATTTTLNCAEPTASECKWDRTAWLVERAQQGDRLAFGELVEQFQPTVFALCKQRLGDFNEASEQTQEVFIHAMRRIGQLREPERFAGWLKQMAVRMSINRVTRRRSPTSLDQVFLEDAAVEAHDPLGGLIAQEEVHQLRACLDRLCPMDRETLLAFYFQGLSILEVAALHGAPVGTIKRRLHTARGRLRELLEPDFRPDSDGDDEPDGGPDSPSDDPTPEPGSRARRGSRSPSRHSPSLVLV